MSELKKLIDAAVKNCDPFSSDVTMERAELASWLMVNAKAINELIEASNNLNQLLHSLNELQPDLRRKIRETGFRETLIKLQGEKDAR